MILTGVTRRKARWAPTPCIALLAAAALPTALPATPASGQNLIDNGSFESGRNSAPEEICCANLEVVPAESNLLAPWSVAGGGVELRGRGDDCPEGAAGGQRWIRLGTGSVGGSVEQSFATRPGERYVCRFRRWVQSPPGPSVPMQVVGPGFSVLMQLPSDGQECEPPIAATSSVEFDAIGGASAIRFVYGGGPASWNVSIDEVMIVPVEDCDGDGVIDGLAIADGLVADSDGDGTPDGCDCRGDVDGDGSVGPIELSILLGNWGTPIPPTLDADGDGLAGGADLGELLGNWGPCS